MPRIGLDDGLDLHCYVDDFTSPWEAQVPVVLLHAYGRNGLFWNPWVPLLADRRAVFRPEIVGCGRSSVPAHGYAFDVPHLLQSMLSVLDHFELERVHWVGEASGGMLGLVLALRHPERLASLTLCNTSAQIPAAKVSDAYTLGEDSTPAAIRKHGVPRWVAQTISGRIDTSVASPALVRWMVEQMSDTPEHVAVGLFECFSTLDLAADLPQVTAPTLLLSGADSPVASHQRDMAAAMPNAQARTIAGCGHGVNYVFPQRCVQETLRFWDDVARHSFDVPQPVPGAASGG